MSPAQLALPPYTVSSTNPLPAGVSAKQVVQDVVIDNLIENAALVDSRPSLLGYSDYGDVLQLDESQIASNVSSGVDVLRVTDSVTSMTLGTKMDPNNAASDLALDIRGTQVTRQRDRAGKVTSNKGGFAILLWVIWSSSHDRYLECDVSSS